MRQLWLVLLCWGLASCATYTPEAFPDDPAFAPLPPEPAAKPVLNTGSLYANGLSNGLYSDNKARREGDIITVVVAENNTASNSVGKIHHRGYEWYA